MPLKEFPDMPLGVTASTSRAVSAASRGVSEQVWCIFDYQKVNSSHSRELAKSESLVGYLEASPGWREGGACCEEPDTRSTVAEMDPVKEEIQKQLPACVLSPLFSCCTQVFHFGDGWGDGARGRKQNGVCSTEYL